MIATSITVAVHAYRVEAEQAFPGTSESIPAIRRWVAKHLTGINPRVVADTQLAASELATNVLLHTLSLGRKYSAWLGVGVRGGVDTCVQMVVVDEGPDHSLADPERPGGWGLAIVREVTTEHGHINLDDGAHAAWFHIAIPEEVTS